MNITEELSNYISGWDIQNYILYILFYRYLSENSVKEKIYHIPTNQLFCNVLSNADSNHNLCKTLKNIFDNIESMSPVFNGIFNDFDIVSNRLGANIDIKNNNILKIMQCVNKINIEEYINSNIDVFGDAYEYLLDIYATKSRKILGQYFTPSEVSELLVRLASMDKNGANKVYDPSCGSGSLLLKSKKISYEKGLDLSYFGQDINQTTYNICKMNMILHNIPFGEFNISCGDTLLNPKHENYAPFEIIVSNPPYSTKWAGDTNHLLINDHRFSPAGVLAPKSKADMAFIMHCMSMLSSNGTAAIVCFPGIMYRGGAEQKIRKYLVDNNFVDCIIQLPSNLFFGTSIATCIMVLKKNKTDDNTLFIDATNECMKVANNNKLTDENISKIVSVFAKREETQHFSKLVSRNGIEDNNYNLSISTYVETKDTREQINIQELNSRIGRISFYCDYLRNEIDEIINGIDD